MAVQGLVQSLTGSGKPQQGAVMAKQLQPTMATSNPALSTTNLLHELDASAQEVIAKVAAAQVSTLLWLSTFHSLQELANSWQLCCCQHWQK